VLATDELTWVQGWVPVAKGEQRWRVAAVVQSRPGNVRR